jgi:hypothetical protein
LYAKDITAIDFDAFNTLAADVKLAATEEGGIDLVRECVQ